MSDKASPHKDKRHLKDTARLTLRGAVLSGTAGVAGAAGALAAANKFFKEELKKRKKSKKNPHKD